MASELEVEAITYISCQSPKSRLIGHLAFDWDLEYVGRMTKMMATVSAMSVLSLVVVTQHLSLGQGKAPKTNPKLLITECAGDGFEVWVPYPGRHKIARVADLDLEADSPTGQGDETFWFTREKNEIFEFSVDDMYSQSVWIAVDRDRTLLSTPNQAHIALTYSDGGGIGGFHVRVFLIDGKGVRDVSRCIDAAVADFKARHYCETRGNNVTALKWISGDLLLLTEVYPTGDCGRDAGHMEAYLVSVPEGKILGHMTLNQLKHYPGVCLENDDEN